MMETPSVLNDTRVAIKFSSLNSKRLKLKKNIQKVTAIDENKFECLICENIYESILKLRIHVIIDHNGRKVVGKLPFMCKKCGLLYRKRSCLNQHYLQKHPTVYFKGKPQQSYTPVLVEVHKEVVETVAKDALDDFVKVQRTFVEQRYRCDLCNVICKNKAAIRHHKISKHTEQNDWKCLQCNYITKFKQYYIRHIANKHSDSNATLTKKIKHVCEVCGYSTHVKGHLEAHSQTHLEKKNYMCEICGRRTKTKNAMISHRRMHLKDKSYSCGLDDCLFKTVYLTSLKHHRLSHDPEKNTLYCDMCNFKTFNKYMLNTHIEQHKLGEKIFKCSICDFSTAQNVNLKHHMHKHSKEKKFKCNLCSFSYKYENSLRKHMKKHTSDKQKDIGNSLNDLKTTKGIAKSNEKITKQKTKIKIIPENIIINQGNIFENIQNKKASLVEPMKNNIDSNRCYEENVTLLGNYNPNKNLSNHSTQYGIHNNQQYSSVVIHELTSDQSYSNHSENHSNSFVQNNVEDNHYNQHNIITNEGSSSNLIENQNNYIHYNSHDTHEDGNKFESEKNYRNQLQSTSNCSSPYINTKINSNEARSNILDEENCSQLVNENSFIQYNVNNKSHLYGVENSHVTYFNQVENHSNSLVHYKVAEKNVFNEPRNNDIISEISTHQVNGDISFVHYNVNDKNCLNKEHNSSLVQYDIHENSTLTNDFNNFAKNQITEYVSNKSGSDGGVKNCLTHFNTNEIKVLNPTRDHRIFSDLRNLDLSRNFDNTKQNSNQLRSSNNNSFILYDICDKGGQIELENDSNSYVGQSNIAHVRHEGMPLNEYTSDTHCSNEDNFTAYHNLDKGLDLNGSKSNKDSANAIEIVVNKGVLMMSVDCGALSSMENFDYFKDL